MRKKAVMLLGLMCVPSFAQSPTVPGNRAFQGNVDLSGATQFKPRQGTSLPGTCAAGEEFTTSSGGIVTVSLCVSANTWQTVVTTVNNNISPSNVVSITSFGGVADGVTDNSAAILAAANSLTGGGTIYFPAAVSCYMLAAQVNLSGDRYSNITLEGDGYNSCIKASVAIGPSGVGNAMIWFHGASAYSLKNSGISSLRLSGFDQLTSAGPLVAFSNSSNTFVLNSFADTTRDEAFYWNSPADSQNVYVAGTYATNVGGYLDSSSSDQRGAYSINANGAKLIGNVAFQVGMFAEVTGTNEVISNNIFDTAAANAGTLPTPGLTLQATSGFSGIGVTGNIIRNAASAVTFSSNLGGNLISGNIIENCDQGIIVDAQTYADTVQSNYFVDTISGSLGAAIQYASGALAGLIAANNTFQTGATPWAYIVHVLSTTGNVEAVRNIVLGNAAMTTFFDGGSGTNVEFRNNKIVPGSTPAGRNRYTYLGVSFAATDFSGIDASDTLFSTIQPKKVTGAAPVKGTWIAGDIAITPAASITAGGYIGYVCITAGTPGTWHSYGLIN